MHIEPRERAKVARIVRYGGIALVAAWSLLALAAYSATSALSGWLGQMPIADGWVAWSGHLLGQAGGTTIFVVWLVGTLAALALMPNAQATYRMIPCRRLRIARRRRTFSEA